MKVLSRSLRLFLLIILILISKFTLGKSCSSPKLIKLIYGYKLKLCILTVIIGCDVPLPINKLSCQVKLHPELACISKLVEKSDNARVAPISGEERGMTDVEATIDDAQQHAFTIIGLRKRRLSLVQRCAVLGTILVFAFAYLIEKGKPFRHLRTVEASASGW